MKQLYVFLIGILYVFASCASESSNSPKNKFRAFFIANPLVVQQRDPQPDLLLSPLSPHSQFAPENVLKKLNMAIDALVDSINVGGGTAFAEKREGFLEFEKYRLACDLEAVARRYVKQGSVCDELAKVYKGNKFLLDKETFLSPEAIFNYSLPILVGNYKIEIKSQLEKMKLFELRKAIGKDWKLKPSNIEKMQRVLDLYLSEQEIQNYRLFLVNCTFDDLRLNESQYNQLLELKNKFDEAVKKLSS